MRRLPCILILATALASCAPPRLPELAVDLTTELEPGADFAAIYTQLGEGGAFVEWPIPGGEALRGGTRVAEYMDVEPGTYRLALELRGAGGEVIERAERSVALFEANRRVEFRIAAGFEVALTTDYLGGLDFTQIRVSIDGAAPVLVDPPSQAELFDGVVVHRERAPEGSRVGVELSLLDAEGAVVASGSDVSESPRLEVQIVENTRVFAGGGEPIVFFGGPPTDSSPSGSACLWHLGRLTCWGDAASFEAGHLQARDVVGPTRVGGQVSVACQASHLGSCWLEVGGEVHCVRTFFRDCEPNSAQGFDNCASGEWPPRLTEPVVVDSPRELRCGGHLFTLFACLRDAAGALECWGGNVLGELGRPPTDPIEVFTADAPVSPEGAPAFESFATGGAHACGIDAAQHLHCWGWNGNGQVGAGADDARPLTEITAVGEVQLVDASSNSTCVITVAGEMYCWGANEAGAIPGGGENVTAPRRVARGDGAVEIAVGTTHTCVRDAAGNVDCWGGNDQGQLGDGTRAARTTPNRVPLPGAAISIASGQRHSCAAVLAMEEGGERLAVYCWGSNFTGELGVEGADGRTPREVPLETGP